MAIRITHWKQWNENYYKRKTIDRKFFFHHIYTIHHHHHHHCLKKKTLAGNRGTRAAIFIRIIVGENFFKLEESQGMEPSDPNFRGSPLFSRFLPDFRGKIGALSSSRYIAPSISPKFLPLLHSCVGKSRRKKKKATSPPLTRARRSPPTWTTSPFFCIDKKEPARLLNMSSKNYFPSDSSLTVAW